MTRNRPVAAILCLAAICFVSVGAAAAASLSRTYVVKEGVVLEIATEIDSDLQLDSVRFLLGKEEGLKRFVQAGQPRVEVSISNRGEVSRRVGIAIALTDEEGALVGVASGGSRLLPVRSKEQATYVLKFKGIKSHLSRAARFMITVETR